MNFEFMPLDYQKVLNNNDAICEIRLRRGFPVKVKVGIKDFYLTKDKLTVNRNDAIICEDKHICEIINNVTKRSIYAFNDRIKKGYLTFGNGIRIGLAGECVYEHEIVHTIKNFTSLNIRLPHNVKGCSNLLLKKIVVENSIYNTLIVSPPMQGKTTILKDIAINLSNMNIGSVMIIDERGEFVGVKGENIDVIINSDKLFGFEYGIRSLSPRVVITDELQTEFDWKSVEKASNSGVNVIASCHAFDIFDVLKKDYFTKGVFQRYVVLKTREKIGEIYKVYDEDFNEI